jgi:hypothetical protein
MYIHPTNNLGTSELFELPQLYATNTGGSGTPIANPPPQQSVNPRAGTTDTGACPCTKKTIQTTKSLYLSMNPTGNNVTPIVLPVTRKVCKTTDNAAKSTKVDCNSVVAAFKQKYGQGV